MRAGHRAYAIERVFDIGDPIAQGLVHRVLQGPSARFDRHDLGAKQVHAKDIRLLPLDIDGTHVDDTIEPEARASSGRRDAMLARSRLGDDAGFAHPAGEKNLAEHIVDLVRAGVVQLLALEVDFCAAWPTGSCGFLADIAGHPLGVIERARTSGIMGKQIVEFGLESRIRLGGVVVFLEIEDQRHQGFGHDPAAEDAEMPSFVGASAKRIESWWHASAFLAYRSNNY